MNQIQKQNKNRNKKKHTCNKSDQMLKFAG